MVAFSKMLFVAASVTLAAAAPPASSTHKIPLAVASASAAAAANTAASGAVITSQHSTAPVPYTTVDSVSTSKSPASTLVPSATRNDRSIPSETFNDQDQLASEHPDEGDWQEEEDDWEGDADEDRVGDEEEEWEEDKEEDNEDDEDADSDDGHENEYDCEDSDGSDKEDEVITLANGNGLFNVTIPAWVAELLSDSNLIGGLLGFLDVKIGSNIDESEDRVSKGCSERRSVHGGVVASSQPTTSHWPKNSRATPSPTRYTIPTSTTTSSTPEVRYNSPTKEYTSPTPAFRYSTPASNHSFSTTSLSNNFTSSATILSSTKGAKIIVEPIPAMAAE